MSEPINRTDAFDGTDDRLDDALAAAFSPPSSSVLRALSAGLPEVPRVCLHEPDSGASPVVLPSSDQMPARPSPADKYQLHGEIARGGMGAVLKGRDVDLGRDVAVKVLLEQHAGRTELLRRFLEEAQIAGQLQHPGIVPVYELGQREGRPFFSMKLVKGQTLAKLLGGRADPSQDRARLVQVFEQVCQAVAYAHARGVIHRDLKPANVMVGGYGEVLVMDWGLAKVLKRGGVADERRAEGEPATEICTARSAGTPGVGSDTQAGDVMGTPQYMAPEQACGQVDLVDERADVFGLGAMLCEILTGQPPFTGRNAEAMGKAKMMALEDAMGRLEACDAPAELVDLAKRCLDKAPWNRPANAGAVAEAVAAYQQGVAERLRRAELERAEAEGRAAEEVKTRRMAEARADEERKRRRVQLALAATVLLAVTLGGGGWLHVRGEREARRARAGRDVTEALTRAAGLRERARAEAAGGPALIAQAREQAERAAALAEGGLVDADLLERVEQLRADLDEESRDRALVAALDAASLDEAVAAAGENRYAVERAVPRYREALAAYGLPPGQGKPEASAQRLRGRPREVREAVTAALDRWLALATNPRFQSIEPHRSWLEAVLEAAEPGDGWTRQFRAAREEKDAAKRRQVLEKLAAEADVRSLPLGALLGLAGVLRPGQAAKLLRQAQGQHPGDFWVNHDLGMALGAVSPPEGEEAVRFLTAAAALRPDSSVAHSNLGVALSDKGRLDEAVASYRRALELDPEYAAAHTNLGVALYDKGRRDEAIASYRRALELDPKDAAAHNNLGNALRAMGRLDEAVASLRRAVELNPNLAAAHNNLGLTLGAKGRRDEAIASYHRALQLDPNLAAAHTNLGAALRAKGRMDEAVVSYRRAVEADPKSATAYHGLGEALAAMGRRDEAIASYRRALQLDPNLAMAHYNLGNALSDKGRLDEAVASYRRALELDPEYAAAHTNLGVALYDKGRRDEAIASYRRALELDPKDAAAHNNLGNALRAMGRLDEAVANYRRALELDPEYAAAHTNLGAALRQLGRFAESLTAFRRAVEADPNLAEAHCNLGAALRQLGRFAESLTAFRRGHELGAKQPGWRHPSDQWVRDADRLAAQEVNLPAFRRGEYVPAGNADRLALAEVCRVRKLHRSAARLYADAFAADPRLDEDGKAQHRYSAAYHAALAAAGHGEDAAGPATAEQLALRRRALTWLRAQLALNRKFSGDRPAGRAELQRQLRHWQQDADLASLRDAAALAKLAPEERAACERVWADVAALLARAEGKQP